MNAESAIVFVASGIRIEERFAQLRNADFSMVSTVSGSVIAANALLKNADSPIRVESELNVTDASEEQFEKTKSFSTVTPAGIVTLGRLVQFSNANLPMLVTDVGIDTVASASQFWNAPSPIVRRFLRKVALVITLLLPKA